MPASPSKAALRDILDRLLSLRSPRRLAGAALLALTLVGGAEWLAAGHSYRNLIEGEDWSALHDHLRARSKEEGPIFLAQPWLGPSARAMVPELRDWESVAPPDLRGLPRFRVLALAGEDGWSPALQTDLESLPAPSLRQSEAVGPFALHHYEQVSPPPLDSLVTALDRLKVDFAGKHCPRQEDSFRCKVAKATLRAAEIDFRPRHCLAFDGHQSGRYHLEIENFRTGSSLLGHLGFEDFNGRLRSEAPTQLRVLIDDEEVGRALFSDAQGWRSFAMATPPGEHRLTIEVLVTEVGTWHRGSHRARSSYSHAPCLELRSFEAPPNFPSSTNSPDSAPRTPEEGSP